MSTIFGPVPSRRLGRSLGVDLIPYKTCSYDCIYCQLGRTTHKTVERREWVDLDAVLAELETSLDSRPDYITLGGSGEPTLYSRMGELIERIRSMTSIPVAVLTNGSLLWQNEVRRALSPAHLVVPSLDAGNEKMFQAVNRPDESLSFEKMLEGLLAFRNEYQGQYWLEVFFLAGHTAISGEAEQIIQYVEKINPDRVQLNTVSRPAAEEYAASVSSQRMAELASRFPAGTEVIAQFKKPENATFSAHQDDIVEMLKRRPCSLDDIAGGTGLHRNEVVKYIEKLDAQGVLEKRMVGGKLFYSVGRHSEQ